MLCSNVCVWRNSGGSSLIDLVTCLVTAVAVALAVVAHYECMTALGQVALTTRRARTGIVLLILGLLALHIMEIVAFGTACFALLQMDGFGQLLDTASGQPVDRYPDFLYFSAAVYTTLGFGDIVPIGAIRLYTGTLAVTGLVLITWSASFVFVKMQRSWGEV